MASKTARSLFTTVSVWFSVLQDVVSGFESTFYELHFKSEYEFIWDVYIWNFDNLKFISCKLDTDDECNIYHIEIKYQYWKDWILKWNAIFIQFSFKSWNESYISEFHDSICALHIQKYSIHYPNTNKEIWHSNAIFVATEITSYRPIICWDNLTVSTEFGSIKPSPLSCQFWSHL